MNPEQAEAYIRIALASPNMLCSEAPVEILKECSYAGDEPTEFLTSFFSAGHTQWLEQTYGQPAAAYEKERIERAVILLWVRACNLYTSHLFERPDSSWESHFFSDYGLY